jgi:hypothetical protein
MEAESSPRRADRTRGATLARFGRDTSINLMVRSRLQLVMLAYVVKNALRVRPDGRPAINFPPKRRRPTHHGAMTSPRDGYEPIRRG